MSHTPRPNACSSCPPLGGVDRGEAERVGLLIMEMLERLPFGRIEISVSNHKITGIEQCQRFRLDELEATFVPELR